MIWDSDFTVMGADGQALLSLLTAFFTDDFT
jgi:hypothetical protein